MSGVLGLTRPSGGNRDIAGMKAWRLNNARERLTKAGRPVSTLTLADLEEEVARWETEQAQTARDVAADRRGAEERHLDFLAALRTAEIGDVLTDGRGVQWQIGEDGRPVRVTAP